MCVAFDGQLFDQMTLDARRSAPVPASAGRRPYTSRRCRSPRPPAPSPPSSSRSSCPPSVSAAPSDEAVRRLAQRTRVPGFRPGKAPRARPRAAPRPGRVLDDAVEHLVQDAYREALVEQDILPLTNAEVDVVQAEEGKPLIFKATVQVRPEVELGDYKNFNFQPEIDDDRRRPGRPGHRGAARPERDARRPVEDRGAQGRRLRGHLVRRARATASRSRAARPSGCR